MVFSLYVRVSFFTWLCAQEPLTSHIFSSGLYLFLNLSLLRLRVHAFISLQAPQQNLSGGSTDSVCVVHQLIIRSQQEKEHKGCPRGNHQPLQQYPFI